MAGQKEANGVEIREKPYHDSLALVLYNMT